MKIDILTVGGSPRNVTEKTVYGDGVQLGVGGAELALLTMCRVWTDIGHEVTLYNNPRELNASCFEQKNEDEFNPGSNRDILLYFRGPNSRGIDAKGRKVWWSCDQHTEGDYPSLAKEVHEVVTISDFHNNYFQKYYGFSGTVIDIPVREWDYQIDVKKNPMQVIFCSVPERGLMELLPIWEVVTEHVPEAQLHITSDHRLWDCNVGMSSTNRYRLAFGKFKNVHYHSAVSRRELVELQMQSSIQLYPNIYDELFCISNAECQYAGAYPITSSVGALATTNMGYVAKNNPVLREGQIELAMTAIQHLTHLPTLEYMGKLVSKLAKNRFSLDRAVDKWDEVFNG